MNKTFQRRLAWTLIALGLVVAASGGALLLQRYFTVEVVPGLILVDSPRKIETIYWRLEETPEGTLIRAAGGRYEGWYLDADETVSQFVADSWENNRFLVLSRDRRESSYWKLETTPDGSLIRAAKGPFEGLYFDIAAGDEPIERGGLRFRRNLLIGRVQFTWSFSTTDAGVVIRAGTDGGPALGYDPSGSPESVWKKSPEERRKDTERAFGRRLHSGGVRGLPKR